MELSEADVTFAFAEWLSADEWTVKPCEHDRWLDLYAERGGQKLLVEVKGKTSEPGIDSDIAYGQLLRRMPNDDDPDARFALVFPARPRSVRAAQRVPARIREQLRISIYTVDENRHVALLDPT